jgi:hypothetical protein
MSVYIVSYILSKKKEIHSKEEIILFVKNISELNLASDKLGIGFGSSESMDNARFSISKSSISIEELISQIEDNYDKHDYVCIELGNVKLGENNETSLFFISSKKSKSIKIKNNWLEKVKYYSNINEYFVFEGEIEQIENTEVFTHCTDFFYKYKTAFSAA